jgi:hypothetical protein
MTIMDAITLARTGFNGSVDVDEPWIARTNRTMLPFASQVSATTFSPGKVDLAYLRDVIDARPWTPADAD